MNKNILIADDNVNICNILDDYLGKKNYLNVCGISNNGIDALNKIIKLKPDIILLDLILPRLDGIEILKILNKKNLKNYISKIIIISAVGHENILKEAFSYGIKYYMLKPFNLCSLNSRIDSIINENKPDLGAFYTDPSKDTYILKNLIKLGIPTNILGYKYINDSLKIILSKSENWLISDIYNSISKKYLTSEACVENAIRNAIVQAYKKNNAFFEKIFPKNISKSRPSNSIFLTALAEYIKIEID